MNNNDIARFWEKVEKTSGCWIWKGQITAKGYGRFWLSGRMERAHRVVVIMHSGDILPGMCVLHHCDNPLCVNPAHLYTGTFGDNNRDTVKRGRHVCLPVYGEDVSSSKLKSFQVKKIKEMLKANVPRREIARKYNVHKVTIGKIDRGETWGHIT